jgi:hypothetical protein
MQTIFIFTHLIMVAAVSAMLYIVFGTETGEIETYHSNPVVWGPHLLKKFKASAWGIKARVILLSGYISSLKITIRLSRKPGHTDITVSN